ncbi:TPA: hypothetical protein ACGPBH_000194 [Streptococcus suis]|nr:hypothetical protein [Streptococcus suis]
MNIPGPKIYLKKGEDFNKIEPTVDKEIIGFLKFSDYNKDDGETENHFQQLVSGKIFFPPIKLFEGKGTEAQKAIEGSTEYTKYVYGNGNVSLSTAMITTTGKNYCIQVPKGVKFVDKENLILDNFPMCPNYLNPARLQTAIKEYFKSGDNDILLAPDRFIRRGDKEENGVVYDYYHFDNFKLEINSSLETTWRISCFTQITKNDIENDKLSSTFIEKLLNQETDKGSIAFDDKGDFRPFIYVDVNTMKDALKRREFYYGSVHYYDKKKKKYTYSFDDVVRTPDIILLEKPSEYKDQSEFRIIVGGPNKEFGKLDNPLVDLFDSKMIKSGESETDLKNIEIT